MVRIYSSTPRWPAALSSVALIIVTGLASISSAQAKPSHPKLEHRLDAVAQLAAIGPPGAGAAYARAHGIKMKGAAMQVVAVPWPGLHSASIDWLALAAQGAVVDAVSDFGLRLLVRPQDLAAVADDPTISFLRPPLSAVAAEVISEGVLLTGAADLHAAGITGLGVKVAVIDLGFIGLADAIAADELPPNTETFDYTGTGMEAGTEHGTAVAEVVHDMAPGAELLLMKVGDEFDLELAKDDALTEGARIANHSVGWVNGSYYDDTGPISAVVNDARASGMLWCNAAGNDAQRHWQGMFVDTDGDDWHEFSALDETNTLSSGPSTRYIFLTWNDWPASDQDLDLYLLDKNGRIVWGSENVQDGTQEPTEAIVVWPTGPAPYRIAVHAWSVTQPMEIELFSFDHDFEYQVADSSLMDPACASGATTVGAIDVTNYTAGPIQYFSSRGPTNDGRTKPDLSAPDGNVSWTYGTFYGTSSASPHVAGAAALLLEQDPSLTADQLHAKLEADAIDMGIEGKDNTYGAGRLNLPPPNQPPTCTVTVGPDPVDCGTPTTVTVSASDPDGVVVGYDVDYGDGSPHETSAATEHIYALGGAYPIAVVVTDDGGATGTCSTTVTVNNLPPTCAITYEPAEPIAGEAVTFHANASDPCGEVVGAWWDFDDGHPGAGLDTAHTYEGPGFYHVCATVTDDQGAEATCCLDVVVHGGEMICWTLLGPCWHMITIPCQPVDPRPESVFKDDLGGPIPISGNLHRYDHDGQDYVTYWTHSPSEFGLIEPGVGYWLYLFEPTTICYEATCAADPPSQSFATAGWYLMGMPVPADLGADEPLWYQGQAGPATLSSIANIWVQDPLISYDWGFGGYLSHGVLPTDETDIFPAFRGYWLYTFLDDVTMAVPPP